MCDLLTVDLCGRWELSNKRNTYNVPATVPGSMYTALQQAAILKDPYFRFNDAEYRWVAWEDWTYERCFNVPPGTLDKQAVRLVCDGLDTVADIFINGTHVGSAENQFRQYVYNVKDAIKTGENSVRVCLRSAPRYAEERAREHPYLVPPVVNGYAVLPEPLVNFIRKAQCSFAWDWGPSFPTQGIWQPIRVEAYDHVAIRNVVPTPSKEGEKWQMSVCVHFDVASRDIKGHVEVSMPGLKVTERREVTLSPEDNTVTLSVIVQNVEAWWPRGYGKQKLYDLDLSFTPASAEIPSCSKSIRTGFRTIQLVQDKMKQGYSFYFKVNGRPIFLKGSNWIPIDCFTERVTRKKIQQLMAASVAANMNVVRVWGGGAYQADYFYELADSLGLLVWQDLMFACSMYPADEAFLENVRQELSYQVKRLSHHPCIICWTGNNENEGALVDDWFGTSSDYARYAADYRALYVDTVRAEVSRQDPGRPFLLSSPSNGPISEESLCCISKEPKPSSSVAGTVHYYNYADDGLDPSIYPRPRFAAEYGLQSWPSFHTVKKVSEPADWNINSGFARHRQRNWSAQQGMDQNLHRHFRFPDSADAEKDFRDYIYLTQIQQSLVYKIQTEVYRRGQGDPDVRTMGAIYWQHNDIWQGPTWATIDWEGNWKMAHYYARDFFADVAVSSFMDQGHVTVYGINDTTRDLDLLTLSVKIMCWEQQTPVHSASVQCKLPAQNAVQIHRLAIEDVMSAVGRDMEELVFTFQLLQGEETISPVSPLFPVSMKDVKGMKKPCLAVTNVTAVTDRELSVTLTSRAVAAFVWLEASVIPGRFSNNGFLMTEASSTVTFYSERDTSVEELVGCLEFKSLADIYD